MAQKHDGLSLRKGATKDTWWLEFVFEGVRHRVRIGSGISRTVAREIAAVKRGAILKGEAGIGGKKRKDISFEKAVEEFMKWVEANKRPRTVNFYRSCFHRLSESFKGMMLGQIHPFLVEKHKQKRVAAGHRVAVNRELAALSAMFNRCIDWGKFEGVHPVRKVERLDEPLSRLRFLSEEEEQRLLKECQEPLRSIVLLGIYAGLRINAEALTLKKQSVNLARKSLTIEAAYSKNGDTQTIPLHSKLVDPLRRFLESGAVELLFTNPAGGRIRSVRTAFTNACERATLSDVTPHTLRHTFASRLGMKGVNDITLQTLGRWKEPKMIRRYAHLSQEHLADAIEQIGSEVPTGVPTPKAVAS